jgi:hypothetical protein
MDTDVANIKSNDRIRGYGLSADVWSFGVVVRQISRLSPLNLPDFL